MPEPADSWAPHEDDTVTCVGCDDEVCVADTVYYPESAGGYLCWRCDD